MGLYPKVIQARIMAEQQRLPTAYKLAQALAHRG